MGNKQISLESKDCKSKHRWYDVIVAWASGEKIQYNFENTGWRDYSLGLDRIPGFSDRDTEWRIKPKTITKKYRLALFSDGEVVAYDVTNSCLDDPIEYKLVGFIRWVGDTVDVEIEV